MAFEVRTVPFKKVFRLLWGQSIEEVKGAPGRLKIADGFCTLRFNSKQPKILGVGIRALGCKIKGLEKLVLFKMHTGQLVQSRLAIYRIFCQHFIQLHGQVSPASNAVGFGFIERAA